MRKIKLIKGRILWSTHSIIRVAILIGICLLSHLAIAQNEGQLKEARLETVAVLLEEQGFQNISISTFSEDVYVCLENRVYRFEPLALNNIMKLLIPVVGKQYKNLILISKYRNIPIVYTKIPLSDLESNKEQDISMIDLSQKITTDYDLSTLRKNLDSPIKNSGNYKLELVLQPQVRLGLGGFPDAVAHQINLLPALNVYLWTGAKLTFQAIIPISDELDNPQQDFVRPSLISFNQMVRFPQNTFVEFSLGYFTNQRYGVDLKVGKFFWKDRLFLKGKVGYTGYASYPIIIAAPEPEKGWEFADIGYFDYKVGLIYRIPKWDLSIGVEYGKVLLHDKMLRMDISRQFNEFDLGFFAFKNNVGENYGVRVSIPFFPKKYLKPGFITVRPARKFHFAYHGDRFFVQQQATGSGLFQLPNRFSPSFIRNQLSRYGD